MNRDNRFSRMQNAWAPPRELTRSAPREVRLSRCGVVLAVCSAALALSALVIAVWGSRTAARQAEEARRLETEGAPTDARIIRLWKTSGEGTKYRIAYSFTAEGRVFHKQLKMPRQIWETLHEGGTIPIRYVASDPGIHHPSAWSPKPLSSWFPILAPAGIIGMSLLMAYCVKRQSDLLASGRPAPAIVTDIRRGHHAPEGRATMMHYEFRTAGGGIIKGKTEHRKGAVPGAIFCAVYDPDNPRRSALYPLCLVRVARN